MTPPKIDPRPHGDHLAPCTPASAEETLLLWQTWATSCSVEELTARIAHDLIQPLSDIVNYVWLCRESIESSSVAHEPLAGIEDQAMRLAEMIRRVRRFVGTLDVGQTSIEQSGPCDTVF